GPGRPPDVHAHGAPDASRTGRRDRGARRSLGVDGARAGAPCRRGAQAVGPMTGGVWRPLGFLVLMLGFGLRLDSEWPGVGGVLAAARPAWIAAVVLASLATVYIRAQRWCVLLRPVGRVPLYPALSATAIGFGASSVLPFRAGELVRPALLGRQPGVGMSAALSSVVLERLFDMLLVIGCFLAVALVNPEVPPDMRRGAFALAALAAAAVFLPQAPGFVGTWQAGCVLALRLFDVPHEVAVGFSLLTWVIQMAVNIATGGIFLAREDLPLARLLRLASREAPAPAA